MFRRDYMMRQLDEMSRALATLATRLLGFQSAQRQQALLDTQAEIDKQLGLDFEALTAYPTQDIARWLLSHPHIRPELFDDMARVLMHLGLLYENTEPHRALMYYEKALALCYYLETDTRLLHFGRPELKRQLEKRIDTL